MGENNAKNKMTTFAFPTLDNLYSMVCIKAQVGARYRVGWWGRGKGAFPKL
jgi:hypothetical protein